MDADNIAAFIAGLIAMYGLFALVLGISLLRLWQAPSTVYTVVCVHEGRVVSCNVYRSPEAAWEAYSRATPSHARYYALRRLDS